MDKPVDILLVAPWFGGLEKNSRGKVHLGRGGEYPISIINLATYIEKYGFKSRVIDMNLERNPLGLLKQELKFNRPWVVGITAYSANIANAIVVSRIVKELDDTIKVILGGFHATALPAECLRRYPTIDYIIHSEGEVALLNLLTSLGGTGNIKDIANLAYRDHNHVVINPVGPLIDLDDLDFPAIEKLDFNRYKPLPTNYHHLPTIGLMASRGCPYRCSFCGTSFGWNRKVRRMSRQLLVDWLEKLGVDYGIYDFRFYDDLFTFPATTIQEFCTEVLKRNLRIHWNCYSRVDTVDAKILALMKRAGCYHIKYGIEAGTPKSLARIKKEIDLDQVKRAINLTKKANIEAKGSFMIGIHEESISDIKRTIGFACGLGLDFATFEPLVILPGSTDFSEYQRQGRIPDNFNWDVPLYTSTLNRKTLEGFVKVAKLRFYFHPKYLYERLRLLIKNPSREIARNINALLYLFFDHCIPNSFNNLRLNKDTHIYTKKSRNF